MRPGRLARALPLLLLLCAAPKRAVVHREAYGPPLPPTPYELCEQAVAQARTPAIPATLLPAIARVESGRPDPVTGQVRPWPWTINVEGVGSFYDTKEAVIAAVQGFQARGIRSIDVGCMQVNLMYHPNAFPDLEAAFDPGTNAAYAVKFLSGLYAQVKDWSLATAMYHSQAQAEGEDYQRRVFGRVMTPMGPSLGGAATGPMAPKWLPPGVMFGAIPPASSMFGAFAPPSLAFGAFAPAGTAFQAVPAARPRAQATTRR